MLQGVHGGRCQGLFHLRGGLGRSGVGGGMKMELTKHMGVSRPTHTGQ